jgi:FAD:protein FMN transferase
MDKKTIFLLIAGLLILSACGKKPETIRWAGQTMGTSYHITVMAESMTDSRLESLQAKVDSALIEINRQMSTYDPNSEISRFNEHKSSDPFPISPQFKKVLENAALIWELSEGAFDVTVAPLVRLWGFGYKGVPRDIVANEDILQTQENIGMDKLIIGENTISKLNPNLELDLSAIAKGFGVDEVAALLKNEGYPNTLVEIGGEVLASGLKHKRKWILGIDAPNDHRLPGEIIQQRIQNTNAGIATSGDYRSFYMQGVKRLSHTIDPRSGRPVNHNLASVSIIASNCTLADAYATAVMVLGEKEGLKLIENLPDVEGYLILRDSASHFSTKYSSGFEKIMIP